MSEPSETVQESKPEGKLAHAIREVKNATADRDDVVVEMREAERMRLELLLQELRAVIEEVPADDPAFDFVISSGLQPRLWIDAVSHVSMGRDRRTYRFLRDTRLGRTVLAESAELKPVAERVTRYVAERIVERQRIVEGDRAPEAAPAPSGAEPAAPAKSGGSRFLSGLLLVLAGGLVGLTATLLLLRPDLSTLGF